ncbi:MAG: phytanoyl-CoA dioxygenase family protein [bacterium]
MKISLDTVARFRSDGVVHLPALLDSTALDLARAAFDWSLANPGRGATRLTPGSPGAFYGDLANPACFPAYEAVNDQTQIPDVICALWQKPDIWFMYEQVFHKTGGEIEMARRTPWHQDLPYLPIAGNDLAVAWIAFEPLAAEESLEFVRGSHRGTLYDGSKFDPSDDTIPLYGTGDLPRLPDIEAARGDYDIVSFAVAPGDVLIFHPAMLHGGAAVAPGKTRRTLSLRYFGEDATVAWRPGDTMERIARIGDGPNVHPMILAKKAGVDAPFRNSGFPKLRG